MKEYLKKINMIYGINNLSLTSIFFSVIVILIDYFDITSIFYKNKSILYLIIIIIGYVILSFIIKFIIYYIKIRKHNNKGITDIDKYLIILNMTSTILLLYSVFIKKKIYIILTSTFFILTFLYITYKMIKYNLTIRNNEERRESKDNIISLKKACYEKVDLKDYKNLVLFSEKESEYDLLNRKSTIDLLFYTIVNNTANENFTIGINGKWGSGKTTIINIVIKRIRESKRSNEFEIIKFDPWQYNDEKVMIRELLTKILNVTNSKLTTENEIINEVLETIFDLELEKNRFIKESINILKNESNKLNIVNVINDYLTINNKKLILVIDNLDRIDIERAYLLIKCIEYTLNFSNTINVILYDENIMKNAFKEKFKIEENYMEKLVQLKVNIPVIDKEVMNNLKRRVFSNLVYNDKKIFNIRNKNLLEFTDIRKFKIFLNYIMTYRLRDNDELNKDDKILMLYIRNECPYLFYEIWNHPKYFVTYGTMGPLTLAINIRELGEETKNYFDNLMNSLSNYDKKINYIECLKVLFPNFNNYIENKKIFRNEKTDVKIGSISDERYFDLFFTDEENNYTLINELVTKTIKKINSKQLSRKENILLSTISKNDSKQNEIFFELMQLRFNEIEKSKLISIARMIPSCYLQISKKDAYENDITLYRMASILANILTTMKKNELNNFLNNYLNKYIYLSLLYTIILEMKDEKKDCELIQNKFTKICYNIFKSKIDIFSRENFNPLIIFDLYYYDEERTIKLLKSIANSKNIYNILRCFIYVEKNTEGYTYSISQNYFKSMLKTIDVNKLLKENKKRLSEKEKFIKKVYDSDIKIFSSKYML